MRLAPLCTLNLRYSGDGAEVMIEMSGRTIFADPSSGHQLLFVLFESADPSYAWLNDVVCLGEGRITTGTAESLIDVHLCDSDQTSD